MKRPSEITPEQHERFDLAFNLRFFKREYLKCVGPDQVWRAEFWKGQAWKFTADADVDLKARKAIVKWIDGWGRCPKSTAKK